MLEEHTYDGERLTIRASVWKLSLMALGSLVFSAVSGLMALSAVLGMVRGGLFVAVVAALVLLVMLAGVVLFGTSLLWALYRLVLFRRPVFVAGPEGICDRASWMGAGWMRWEEISTVTCSRQGRQTWLLVHLADEEATLARQSPPKRLLMRLGASFTGTPVNIPPTALPVSSRKLREEVEARRRRYASR